MNPLLNLPRVQFDFGAVAVLREELAGLDISTPLFITDRGVVDCGVFEQVRRIMNSGERLALVDDIPPNPTLDGVNRSVDAYRAARCDGIVAVGGGSVIDSAKAVALLATHAGRLSGYHGHPERITRACAPIIAIPTTAGTGSEATRGAGIHPDANSRTAGVNSQHLVPRVAICDPELTVSLPPALTAGTGMDALTHCVEGYLAPAVNPVVDAIALDGIRRVVAWIERAVADGRDREARWHMMMAALEGGIGISKGLGPAHALGNTFGDRGLHHGALVTLALPATIRFLAPHVGDRMAPLADALGAPGGDAADAVAALTRRVGLPATLKKLGYGQADLEEAAGDAARSFFNARCARPPTLAEYRAMIDEIAG